MAETQRVEMDVDVDETFPDLEEPSLGGGEEEEIEVPEDEEIPEEPEKPKPEVAELRRVANLLEADLKERQKGPKKREDEEPTKKSDALSDEQLIQVINEYKDNPGVLLQVFKHVAKQEALTIRDDTVHSERQRQWAENTRTSSMGIVKEEYGKLNQEEQNQVQEVLPGLIDSLGLATHPVGPLAAFAIVRMAQLTQSKAAVKEKEPKTEEKPKTKGQMDKTRRTAGAGAVESEGRLTAEDKELLKVLGVRDPKLFLKYKSQGV